LQRGLLGALTSGAGALAIGLGGTVVKNIRKNSEYGGDDSLIVKIPRSSLEELIKGNMEKEELLKKTVTKIVDFDKSVSTTKGGGGSVVDTSTGTGIGGGTSGSTSENLNNVNDKVDLGRGDGSNFIPSLLDGNLSPLEVLINCEILINIMILFHIILLVLILIHKFNIKTVTSGGVGFISRISNKYKLNKLQNFINKIGAMNNKYLSLLIIINVFIIVFYIFLNVYINLELSSNLNEYIHVYNKFHFKKSGILLLLLNSNIKYKNTRVLSDKNKYVNRLEQRLYSSSNLINDNSLSNSNSNSISNNNSNSSSNSSNNIEVLIKSKSNVLTNEKKIMELIDDHLSFKSVVSEKRKIYKNKEDEIRSDKYEKNQYEKSFIELLMYEKDTDLLDEYNLIDYDQKVKILNIWWNEKMNRSLNKRSEYFKKESVFYSQISDILNLKNENVTFTIKQLRLEK
jgi:hypothetical protein